MIITTTKTRRKTGISGTVGLIPKSTGYLQGGYKDSTIHSALQLFNTITQVGQIVVDTGYQRRYTPGISGDLYGFYSYNDTANFKQMNYATYASSEALFAVTPYPKMSAFDFGKSTESWIVTSATSPTWTGTADCNGGWKKITLNTGTLTDYGSLSTRPLGTTRQGGNNAQMAFFVTTSNNFDQLNFSTRAVTTSVSHSLANSTSMQIPCAMSRNQSSSYFVGMSGYNLRMALSGASITSITQTTSYGYNFGESHSVTADFEGFMMAGYSDTSGRYGGTQHGLAQKIIFSSDSIVTLADLVVPQSSGQMMQGF